MLVMVSAFSRFIAAVMLPSRQTMDLVAGMWQFALGQLHRGAPRAVVGQRGRDRPSGPVDRAGHRLGGHAAVAAGATQTL